MYYKIQGYDPTYIFCASNDRKGTCFGDSGGPIVDWKPIDGVLNLTTVIGTPSFGIDIVENNTIAQCNDFTGLPLSYFADIQAGWDWIYETINGTKLLTNVTLIQ